MGKRNLRALSRMFGNPDHYESETGWRSDRQKCGMLGLRRVQSLDEMDWETSSFPCRETHKVLKMSCTVFVVEKLNWTQLLEELELELRHMDETQLRLMEQKDSNFARAIHHRREDPFYHKRKPFGYWNKLRLCAICWLFTNCRCHYACLLFEYLIEYLHGKREKQWLSATNQAKTKNSNQEWFSLSRK